METTFSPFKDLDLFPVDIIEDRAHVSPEAIIEWAIGRHRKSMYSDNELATYICELLAFIMCKNGLLIKQKDVRDCVNRFRIIKFIKDSR
jgi:hypothetical protein